MLKKLTKREIENFIKRYEIKCESITLEKIQDECFIIIDEKIRFKVDYSLISSFV